MSDDKNIVKSVLFGVAISVLLLEVAENLPKFLLEVSSFTGLKLAWNDLKGYCCTSSKWVCLLWQVLFFASYFYDECLEHDKNEKIFFILAGWIFYILQAALVSRNVILSGVCGIVGTVVVSSGLLFTPVKNKWWYLTENGIWCVALSRICFYSDCFWLPLGIILIKVIRVITGKKWCDRNEQTM